MKKGLCALLAGLLLLSSLPWALAEQTEWVVQVQAVPSGFTFRNGVAFGMSLEEVTRLEKEISPDANMTTEEFNGIMMFMVEAAEVSNYRANLSYAFFQDQLALMLYDFYRYEATLAESDYAYLTEALSAVYGEKSAADNQEILKVMDRVVPDLYNLDSFQEAWTWRAGGATIFQLYYQENQFAILYVNPALDDSFYQQPEPLNTTWL